MSNGSAVSTVFGYERPLGYQQIVAATLATAQNFTLPAAIPGMQIRRAIVQNNTSGAVRWRDDGQAPTATVGMVLGANSELDYGGQMQAIQFITDSGSPILDISYYA
jgi:hypothetical protein